ncbi:MAG: diguanylate cyclase [Alphaproteobacteria bacterium]|nr:diguanylate cyclase [Alphaproteobacteria bacterium]
MPMNPKNRLRNSFAEVVKRQAGEIAELARDAQGDLDVRDALAFELDRVASTASSLGLLPIERAARAALAAEDDAAFLELTQQLVDATRALEGVQPLFRPVVVIGVKTPVRDDIAVDLRTSPDIEGALALADAEDPAAFVVPAKRLGELFERLEGALKAVPVFAAGRGTDLELRMDAVRLGAAGYVGTPVDLDAVLDLVRARAREVDPPPYRVLVVEPDDVHAQQLLDSLQGPEQEVTRVRDGATMLATLDRFRPELVLIAGRGPNHDGALLAQVIHAHEAHGGIPVLLMIDGDEVDRQALVASADDVVHKPWSPTQLRARVLARLRRAREVELSRVVDRLTCTLSRRAMLRAADREIGLARRANKPLSAVLIDIDSMSELNRRVGLGGGDEVIRGVASVLLETFRDTDVVGRVGGDSFCVLMPACVGFDARKRVESLRPLLHQWGEEAGFPDVDISVGIADTRHHEADVLARADRALLQARNGGGGRTVVDEHSAAASGAASPPPGET